MMKSDSSQLLFAPPRTGMSIGMNILYFDDLAWYKKPPASRTDQIGNDGQDVQSKPKPDKRK